MKETVFPKLNETISQHQLTYWRVALKLSLLWLTPRSLPNSRSFIVRVCLLVASNEYYYYSFFFIFCFIASCHTMMNRRKISGIVFILCLSVLCSRQSACLAEYSRFCVISSFVRSLLKTTTGYHDNWQESSTFAVANATVFSI